MKRIIPIITLLLLIVGISAKSSELLPESKYVLVGKDSYEMKYLASDSFKHSAEERYGMSVLIDTFDMYNGVIKVVMTYPSDCRLSVSTRYQYELGIEPSNKILISRYGATITLAENIYWYGDDDTIDKSSITVNGNKVFERGSVFINSFEGGKLEMKYGILYVHNLLNVDLERTYIPLTIGYIASPEQDEVYYHFFSNIEIITPFFHKYK